MVKLAYCLIVLQLFTVNTVGSCIAYGCNNRQKKGGDISFFHFPHKNPELLKRWVHAVRRADWFPVS